MSYYEFIIYTFSKARPCDECPTGTRNTPKKINTTIVGTGVRALYCTTVRYKALMPYMLRSSLCVLVELAHHR